MGHKLLSLRGKSDGKFHFKNLFSLKQLKYKPKKKTKQMLVNGAQPPKIKTEIKKKPKN